MKIKYRDIIIDGNDEQVMVVLTDLDKKNISDMLPNCFKYAIFPNGNTVEDGDKADQIAWMDDV